MTARKARAKTNAGPSTVAGCAVGGGCDTTGVGSEALFLLRFVGLLCLRLCGMFWSTMWAEVTFRRRFALVERMLCADFRGHLCRRMGRASFLRLHSSG